MDSTLSLIEFLRPVPMLAGLSQDELGVLVDECSVVELPPGALLFSEGDSGDAAYVVRSGRIEIFKQSGSREILLNVLNAGEVFGEMALIDGSPRIAGARASGQTTVVGIRKSQFQDLLKNSQAAQNAMFLLVVARLKSTEARLRQSERMVQLGTLTAGVAHELNNPASAATRAAGQLAGALEAYHSSCMAFAALGPGPDTVAKVRRFTEDARARASSPSAMDALAQSDMEYEIAEWLEERGVEQPWNLCSDLVSAGYTRADVEQMLGGIEQNTVSTVASLVANTIAVTGLISAIGQTTGRISEIVNALKSYAFLDQAPLQSVSVTEGIDNAILLLGSKLHNRLVVKRTYENGLPDIDAYGSELNQVWTNIIDNAIDAIDGAGEIHVSARAADAGGVVVEIEDTGRGVPPEIQDRIFDAFFTTKEPGSGTGLGLHIAYDVVVNKHGGELSVESVPGRTRFTVRLPAGQIAEPGQEQAEMIELPNVTDEQAKAAFEAGCGECLRIGSDWVHLRMCLVCEKVGCCDSSPMKHASGHYRETGHTIARSIEQDEDWVWNYETEEVVG